MSTRTKLSNQDPFALNYQYKYLPEPGNGIDIYAVDTGAFFLVRSCYGSLNIFFFPSSSGILISHVRELSSDSFRWYLLLCSLISGVVLNGEVSFATAVP